MPALTLFHVKKANSSPEKMGVNAKLSAGEQWGVICTS